MQTPKARTVTVEVPPRTSPTTAKMVRKLKTPGSDGDSVSSSNPASRTPKDRSPKVVGRRSPRSPMIEKKRPPGKVSDLEMQLAQLQEELKKAKDQLTSSESLKKRAQQDADEAKKQFAIMSGKFEDSKKQLLELSDSEEARLLELRKISQDRDREWQSELEAIQKQHELDSAALSSAMNEIQKLRIQLDRAADSEATQAHHTESAYSEIQSLRVELSETLALVEKLRNQLNDSKESEACSLEEVSIAQMQLEVAKITENTLRSEGLKAMEACRTLSLELEKSKDQVASLEKLVGKLQSAQGHGANVVADELKIELKNMQVEESQLRAALEASERKFQEEYIQSTLQIRSAHELVERARYESIQREAEWEAKLNEAKSEVESLKEKLMEKEAEAKAKNISDENQGLSMQLEQMQPSDREFELAAQLKESESILGELKAHLLDKETEMQSLVEENELLKSEIKKRESESTKLNDEALALVETAKSSEREALTKLGNLTEEADKSNRKVARVTEELDAAQAASTEMETELRRLKVQCDQWRKAAEAAASMLSTGNNNGKFVERTGSLDYHTIGGKLGSPLSEDFDDESPKKKNSNMLKKIGVLLKKSQK